MTHATRKIFLQIIAVALILIFALYIAYLAQGSDTIQQIVLDYGYVGIFLLAFATGFNLVVPIPAIAFMPLFLESGLDFWVTIMLITVGITAADSFAYLIGGIGHDMLMKNEKYRRERSIFQKLLILKKKHVYAPLIFLFFYSIIAPLPNELMVIPLALLGYRYLQIFPIVLVGNFIFNIIYAQGVEGLFELFM
ncbi:MAG: hypothetical protein COV34_01790 [Candidatus Zambryskibacteria bacterium CG10_big_fil_rev_8_21_14_0_10_42_12]|uniref:DedA family protein n=1 Tax=Candidatus Zambryskibacteria bacterium CG10_big_fil_rev_8_21_14_0_10_42_12 TaxID=1975115 RepID=A0A2H0QVM1_9BACT|nr:MAG: hypothetical protein COV34_01790 [Candidatus Zambryskibacteria bacterium CG10_big_fil_rev_8_21_14_0_10_42_12]